MLLTQLIPFWGGLACALLITAVIAQSATPRPGRLQLAGLALIGITGGLHLIGGLIWEEWLLVFNGLGFVGLGLAWVLPFSFIPRQHQLISSILIVYTLVTIAGYFVTHTRYDLLGILSKGVELALLLVVVVVFLQRRSASAAS